MISTIHEGAGWFWNVLVPTAIGRRAFIVAVASLVLVPAARAQTSRGPDPDSLVLTLATVQRLALERNVDFLAERQETAIALGQLRQARTFRFNPELSVIGPRGAGSSAELTLMQEIEWAGQRGLRVDAARSGLTGATASVRDAGRLTVANASLAFFAAFAAERRLNVARDARALHDRLLSAVRIQLTEGEISALDANLAEIELGRARARVLSAARESARTSLELAGLIGLGPTTPLRLVVDTASARQVSPGVPLGAPGLSPPSAGGLDSFAFSGFDEDSLTGLALARRPDLVARAAVVRESEKLTALARREALPNLRVGAAAEGDPVGVGLALGLNVPLFNRNQGTIAQQRARTEQARFRQRATELRIRREVATAARAYRNAIEEAAVFQRMVLRPARQNSDLLETAYREGKITLPTLLLLRNQLLEAELGYWEAWLAQREALVLLDAATGAFTPETSGLPTDTESTSRTSP